MASKLSLGGFEWVAWINKMFITRNFVTQIKEHTYLFTSSQKPNLDVIRDHKDENDRTNAWHSMVSACHLWVSVYYINHLTFILRSQRSIKYQIMKPEIPTILIHFSANRECLLHSGGSKPRWNYELGSILGALHTGQWWDTKSLAPPAGHWMRVHAELGW